MSKRLNTNQDFVILDKLTKNFNGFKALNEVSLTIKQGEIFGYIGPNGAGKTTTMKILVGLISDFQGQVTIGGYSAPEKKDEIHKLLGYLPQSVAFQDWRTIDHALKTFGKLSGLTDAQLEERIPPLLDMLGLADARHKRISYLSGGMTQKVGLAQALLHEPKLLVLDEPMGGLDPLSRRQFKDIVLKLAEKGTTVLFSSHILSDVQDVADRVGIISHGRIKEVGTISELKTHFMLQKTVQVLLSGESSSWKQLGSVRNVSEVVQPSSGVVLLKLKAEADADQAVNDIVQKIVELHIPVRGIWQVEPSLDQIYFNYVSEAEN
ncbi:MAG: ABC transporter ATP-binding protein [Candidatus Bathyarchaeota archaeon]|nr:ABC transporter ATP-binding protein [Candidatus Bathyarchaeota archaeon]